MRQKVSVLIPFIILVLILLVGCSNGIPNTEAINNTTIYASNSGITQTKAIERTVNDLINSYYQNISRKIALSKIDVLKIQEYKYSYLALVLYSGEGPELRLVMIAKDKNGEYAIAKTVCGDMAISMGFEANSVEDGKSTILFGNLNEYTWKAITDERKPTDYEKMAIEFDSGRTIEESIKGNKGYIIVADANQKVKDMRLFNSKSEVVISLKDISGIKEKETRRFNNIFGR